MNPSKLDPPNLSDPLLQHFDSGLKQCIGVLTPDRLGAQSGPWPVKWSHRGFVHSIYYCRLLKDKNCMQDLKERISLNTTPLDVTCLSRAGLALWCPLKVSLKIHTSKTELAIQNWPQGQFYFWGLTRFIFADVITLPHRVAPDPRRRFCEEVYHNCRSTRALHIQRRQAAFVYMQRGSPWQQALSVATCVANHLDLQLAAMKSAVICDIINRTKRNQTFVSHIITSESSGTFQPLNTWATWVIFFFLIRI